MQSLIRDISLAAEGRKKIDWVANFNAYFEHN